MCKVLVVVMTAEKMPYLKRIQSCRETWMKHKPAWATIWTISGPKLGVPDSYEMMTYKVKALCRRALMKPDWQWLLRLDDDVCVDWRAVRPPEEGLDYVGPVTQGQEGFKYTQGAVTWLSREAVELLYETLNTGLGLMEDAEVGRVMLKAGIMPTHLDVHQIPRDHKVDSWAFEQLVKLGFVLEVPTPEVMNELHRSLGLEAPPEKGIPIMVQKTSRDKRVAIQGPSGPAVYRDHQGHTIVRSASTFNGDATEAAEIRGPAISRPQVDAAWFKK